MRICRKARYSPELGSAAVEVALWILNITAVFFVPRYLFEMNNPAVFLFGWDTQSILVACGIFLCLTYILLAAATSLVLTLPVQRLAFRKGVAQYLKTLISASTVGDSFAAMAASWRGKPTAQYLPDGLLNADEYFALVPQPNIRATFDRVDAYYVNDAYKPTLESSAPN